MKKLLIGIASLVLACAYAYGQGEVQFNNRIVGTVDARVFMPDGTTPVGEGFTAQLYGGPAGTAAANLVALTPTTTFRSGNAAGYVQPAVVSVPGVAAGQQAAIQMRVFNGASFETASVFGSSEVITVTTGGGALTPGALAGLNSFSLVPEPSTIALGVLGIGALLFMRRRK